MRLVIIGIGLLLLSGCVTINNISSNSGKDSKVNSKADQDQSPQTPVNAALPVSVGAQPNATGTVNAK